MSQRGIEPGGGLLRRTRVPGARLVAVAPAQAGCFLSAFSLSRAPRESGLSRGDAPARTRRSVSVA